MTVQGRLPLFAANTLMSVMSIDLPFAASHPFISDRHSANYRIEQMWRDASNIRIFTGSSNGKGCIIEDL